MLNRRLPFWDPDLELTHLENIQARKEGKTVKQWREERSKRLSNTDSEDNTYDNPLFILLLVITFFVGASFYAIPMIFLTAIVANLTSGWILWVLSVSFPGIVFLITGGLLYYVRSKRPTLYAILILCGIFAFGIYTSNTVSSQTMPNIAFSLFLAAVVVSDTMNVFFRQKFVLRHQTPKPDSDHASLESAQVHKTEPDDRGGWR